ITLDKVTQEAMVTRRFISGVYGGNMQMTFPQISEAKLATHNYGNRFMFLNTDYQPMAPQVPAAPGLFIDCEAEPTDWGESGEWRVFSKVGKAWLFVGFYRLAASKRPSMSQEEWNEQSEKFRNKWALKITQKGWGVRVCARTLARKELNREPTRKEVLDIIDSGRYKATTLDEVKAAYDAGKERMGIWTLKCIGYDNEFQHELSQRFPNWVPPPPKNSGQGRKKASKTPRGQKRKRSDTPEPDLTEHESDDSELNGDNIPENQKEVGVIDISDDE
ncbi:hypothetical protein BDZ97DRAFT_1667283, partial [Flammula alnicola]